MCNSGFLKRSQYFVPWSNWRPVLQPSRYHHETGGSTDVTIQKHLHNLATCGRLDEDYLQAPTALWRCCVVLYDSDRHLEARACSHITSQSRAINTSCAAQYRDPSSPILDLISGRMRSGREPGMQQLHLQRGMNAANFPSHSERALVSPRVAIVRSCDFPQLDVRHLVLNWQLSWCSI